MNTIKKLLMEKIGANIERKSFILKRSEAIELLKYIEELEELNAKNK